MDALELIVLGRRLAKIGERRMRGSQTRGLTTGGGLILADVLANAGSAVGEIAARTGLPQSYVSESVAALREQGVVETEADPHDGRRTLVRVGAGFPPPELARRGSVSVDGALAHAFGARDRAGAAAEIDALEGLALKLRRAGGERGPFARWLEGQRRARSDGARR